MIITPIIGAWFFIMGLKPLVNHRHSRMNIYEFILDAWFHLFGFVMLAMWFGELIRMLREPRQHDDDDQPPLTLIK